jgi:23S rRNA pseudouridine1911/1915/1917 synthase
LHTGRTHQIRVHFQHLGFPVLGDQTYGARQNQRFTELTRIRAPRQMLHATRVTFTHPHTGRTLAVEAPWPEDFCEVMEDLKRDL